MLSPGQRFTAILFGCLCVLTFVCDTRASTPGLTSIVPRGIQRGTETDLSIRGARLEDAKELMIYTPGVTVTSWTIKSASEVVAHVSVDKDARIGEYHARIRSETGISDLRTFYVTPFPIIPFKEAKPDKRGRVYYDFEHPQEIPLNVTITGSIAQEQVQYFAVDMKKGQRLTAEVHGMRLGENFDPYVAILDERRFELALSDDTALAMQDPIASAVIPADGRYIIVLRESSYGSGSHYLLHVGTYPRPTVIYPLGGRPGETLHVKYLGDVAGPIDATITLPNKAIDSYDVFPEQDGLVVPSPNHMRISDLPNVMESEPNDDFKTATNYDGPLPAAFNGVISKEGDVDFFRFKAKKGDNLDIRVVARALRSPLDSVLTLYNAQGNAITSNDDSGSPDSFIRYNVGADCELAISVTDHLHQGGVDYAYRVEITPAKTDLVFSIPEYAQNSQERWTAPVPRGNRYATLMRATRTNVGGEVSLVIPELPKGVTVQAPNPGGDSDLVPVLFEAAADAPIGAKLCVVTGKSVDEKQKVDVVGRYNQRINLVYTGNSPLYNTYVDTLAVGVTKEAPYKLHLEQPKVPLVQGGAMDLKVSVQRAPEFKGNVQVRLLFTPPNLNALPNADIEPTQTETVLPINAQPNAALKTWKICVVGMSDVNGQLWVSSEMIDLTVGEPYVLASAKMTSIMQGKSGTFTYKLDQKTPFTGKAKCKLMGLPANTTAEDMEITSADTTVAFPVTVGEKAVAGPHPSLFCNITVMKDGQPIVHNVGRGANLRVDKIPEPPKAKNDSQGKSAKPETAASRLEKLREGKGNK